MTTVASGRCTSAPAFVDIAIGMNPNAATIAVVSTGRSTVLALRRICCSSVPAERPRRRTRSPAMTTPFNTATPATAMNPTAAGIENGSPRRLSARTPPTSASGTLTNTAIA